MLLFYMLIAAVATLAAVPIPDRYSSCFADRGYTEKDSFEAATFLWQNLTFPSGLLLHTNECVYKHINTTIVSLCNGNARNRTVYQPEVKRGVEQLVKDCGPNGLFSGYHIVNNLTFAAYGIFGGVNKTAPPGANPPDLPGGTRHRSIHSREDDPDDPCVKIWGEDGLERTDCKKLEGHTLNADGSCGEPTPGNKCQVYCEVKRLGMWGMEQKAAGKFGDAQLTMTNLEEGEEVTISSGFSIGIEGILKETIGAGANFEWSISTTKVKTIVYGGTQPPPNAFVRWVFFPRFVETCGTISRRNFVPQAQCQGVGCPGATSGGGTCTGDVETINDQCFLSPRMTGGTPSVVWAVRFEDFNGKPLDIEKQPDSYRTLCMNRNHGNPDGDTDIECAVHD